MRRKLMKNLLLVVAMVVLCLAVGMTASAETWGDYEYSILEDGTVEITDYVGNDSEIKIPAEIEGKDVTSIGYRAFANDDFAKVVFPDTLKIINTYAFDECLKLEAIHIPDSVTQICENAFWECISAVELVIGENVACIDNGAFGKCYSLNKIKIGPNLQYLDSFAFVACYSIESIIVDENNPYMCVDEMGVLYSMDKETLLLYPAGSPAKTYSVYSETKKINDYAFLDMLYLEELILPEGLETIGEGAFYFSSGLKKITIPKSVKTIEDIAFYDVFGLEEIIILSEDVEFGDDVFAYDMHFEPEDIELMKIFCKTPEPSDELMAELLEVLERVYDPENPYIVYSHSGSTAEAYAIANGIDYVLTHFYDDEWTYDYDNMIRFRKCIHCDYTETEPLETTESGDVEIIEPTNPDTDFTVDVIEDYVVIKETISNNITTDFEIVKAFDINLKNKDGVHVQPNGTVKVKLPNDWSKNGVYKVYRVNDDGTLTDMNAYRQGSHLVFDTDHFSIYVIVVEGAENDAPTEPDTPVTPEEEIKDNLFSKIIDFFKSLFELIMSWFNK